MSSPSPGSGFKALCALRPASPAISLLRSKRPRSRSPADRLLAPCSCALSGAEALESPLSDLAQGMLGYLRPSSSTDARNAFPPAALPEPGEHRLYLRRGLARLPFDPAPAATSAS